jgi:hypothetical protein
VLDNLRAIAKLGRWTTLVADLQGQREDGDLAWYLDATGRRAEEVYRSAGKSWTQLRRDAGRPVPPSHEPEVEQQILRSLRRLRHVDDPERVTFYRELLARPRPPKEKEHDERQRRLLRMLSWTVWGAKSEHASTDAAFESLWRQEAFRQELRELLDVLDRQSTTRALPSLMDPSVPLTLHARYSRTEVVAAVGHGTGPTPPSTREGFLWAGAAQSDIFFVDLHKAERDYSPTTMYRDYAINRELFHWESQSRQAPGQPAVQRFIEHAARGTSVLLMVRERKRDALGEAPPYVFLGPVSYVSHEGERPVRFTWRLPRPMPETLFEVARSVAAA